MMLPVDHDPSHAVFQQGLTAATTIEDYLRQIQKLQTQPQPSLPLPPAASAETAGPEGTAVSPIVAARPATNHIANRTAARGPEPT